jgi:(E)-4-hydroxy-3-methyl-but-2-enyl pyrophosphate reductase
MKVKLAKTAGFCMGVRRALEMVLSEANKDGGPLYTFGPLIHNKQVMKLLEAKGVVPVEDLSDLKGGTVVIRAHGIPPQQRKALKASGLEIIDATCPRVARVQSIIRYHTHKGSNTVIVGEEDHPEVFALVGYSNGRAHVISRPEQVGGLPSMDKVIVVAQTTQEKYNYEEVVQAIRERFPQAEIFDTICEATRSRQQEIRSFAPQVDGIVVVGGHHSGNTRRLAQVSRSMDLPTFHVETETDLDRQKLASMEVIGVTAGASTPNWMIKSVVREIEAIRSRKESTLLRGLRDATRRLHQCNVMVAAGAFALSYAATLLSGRNPDLIHPLISSLYIYAMHVLNRFLDKGASTYNDPETASFYRRHRMGFMLTGLLAISAALSFAYTLGMGPFLAMLGLSILGSIYSIPILPSSRRHLWRYSKIKDIPGSKTLSEALAWGAVMVLMPQLEPTKASWIPVAAAFLFVFSVVYVRSALFDIFQVQGDLIVGAETLPITLGEQRTLLLLEGIIFAGGAILALAAVLGFLSSLAYLLILCYISLALSLFTYEKRWLYPGTRLETLIEGNLFLAGLLGFVWQVLQ